MRRYIFFIAMLFGFLLLGLSGFRLYQHLLTQAKSSHEVLGLTEEGRNALRQLRDEAKFKASKYPLYDYTGIENREDRDRAVAAVNGVIDYVLQSPAQSISARMVASRIGMAMRDISDLETEDRERAQGYMLEVWYIIGFKGATGLFTYGAGIRIPPGYAEPLPPGWVAPDKPRAIGRGMGAAS